MREDLTYGLMRGRWRRATGLLDRDTRPKGEKRPGVAGPHAVPRHCSTLQKRNVTEAPPERLRAAVRSALNQAYATRDTKRARRLLENLARRLESAHPGAAGPSWLRRCARMMPQSIAHARLKTGNEPLK